MLSRQMCMYHMPRVVWCSFKLLWDSSITLLFELRLVNELHNCQGLMFSCRVTPNAVAPKTRPQKQWCFRSFPTICIHSIVWNMFMLYLSSSQQQWSRMTTKWGVFPLSFLTGHSKQHRLSQNFSSLDSWSCNHPWKGLCYSCYSMGW